MVSTRSDPDADDDFSEIYKEYTGPPGTKINDTQDVSKSNKRSHAVTEEEEEPRDPNAVPTDFTSREAKVWEAKSKATERNWKKRKEEEMICKICGESGHFTQGCPSTLGANRKSQDFFERVPARDKYMRSLFTEKVIERIERETGCKIKMDEKFLIVSGKDRLILRKGVDAVHKMREDGERKSSFGSHKSRSRSPIRSPITRSRHSESLRSHTGPRGVPNAQQGFGRQDKVVEDRIRDDRRKFSRGSPQAQAYGNDRARSQSKNSKSPGRPHYSGDTYNLYDQSSSGFSYKIDRFDHEKRGSGLRSGPQFEYPTYPQTLEELDLEYQREVMELERIRDKEEDEEKSKHRETMREIRENYMKQLGMTRAVHAKQWEEFLQLDAHRRQQQSRQEMSSKYGGYRSVMYSEYDGFPGNPYYCETASSLDPKGRFPSHVENFLPMPEESYGVFPHQRRDGFGQACNRY